MPEGSDVTKYTHYFNINVPSTLVQTLILLGIGIVAGVLANLIVHSPVMGDFTQYVLSGISIGVMIISLPAILTAIVLKALKRKLEMKRAMFSTFVSTPFYALAIIGAAAIHATLHIDTLAYILLIVSNAAIYGYWFIIYRVVIGQKRGAVITAAVQPVINILLYIPLNSYLFSIGVPINTLLIKLYAGMLVFLFVGYLTLYLIDRPAKKHLDVSGIAIFTAMVHQWLFDVNPSANFLGASGVERNISVDVLSLKAGKKYAAVFVKPDIHYGPFAYVGGSITTETLGNMINWKYKASPFVLHGAVNINDNPISTTQVHNLKRQLDKYIDDMPGSQYRPARGAVGFGSDGVCSAINVKIGDVNLLTLTKAPAVTEDIDREVGISLQKFAERNGSKSILIDAHNSRIESASADELAGIYQGSKYIRRFEKAITKAVTASDSRNRLLFGSASTKLLTQINNKDIGNGYTSVGVFASGRKRFGMIYFDANNMLPGFRDEIISHIKKKFGVDVEVYTTDTHYVNSIALSASNSLGRQTKASQVFPILDELFKASVGRLEPVSYAYGRMSINNFKVWGEGAEELLVSVSKDALRTLKYIVPFVIVAGFIIASWIIYIV